MLRWPLHRQTGLWVGWHHRFQWQLPRPSQWEARVEEIHWWAPADVLVCEWQVRNSCQRKMNCIEREEKVKQGNCRKLTQILLFCFGWQRGKCFNNFITKKWLYPVLQTLKWVIVKVSGGKLSEKVLFTWLTVSFPHHCSFDLYYFSPYFCSSDPIPHVQYTTRYHLFQSLNSLNNPFSEGGFWVKYVPDCLLLVCYLPLMWD